MLVAASGVNVLSFKGVNIPDILPQETKKRLIFAGK